MSAKVSVIVPVYNGEKYLINCLSYLVNQSLQEIEIIIVDDASSDGSRAIMEECYRQYPNKVKCIYLKENRGAGGARNCGITEATGDYIGFVDCDDQVEVEMYEEMYRAAAEGEYDVVDSYLYHEKEKNFVISTPLEAEGLLDDKKRKRLIQNTGYIVTKIFRTAYLRGMGFQFREKAVYEDPDFLCRVYLTARNIFCIKKVLYYYRYNKESTTKAVIPSSYIKQEVDYMKALYQVFAELDKDNQFREALNFKLIYLYGKLMESYIYGEMDFGVTGLRMLQETAINYIDDMHNNLAVEKLDKNIYKLLYINNENPQRILEIKEKL